MRQRPRSRGVGAIATRAVRPDPRETAPDIAHQPLLAAEQMRDSGDVEPQPIRSIHLDQRRPAPGPAREPLHQRGVAFRIGGNRDQRRIERAGVGQPRAGPRAALGGGFRDRMDDRPVRALDGEDDRRVRRVSRSLFAQRSIARCGNQMEAIRFMRDAPAARRHARARGTARRPTPAAPARADRDR